MNLQPSSLWAPSHHGPVPNFFPLRRFRADVTGYPTPDEVEYVQRAAYRQQMQPFGFNGPPLWHGYQPMPVFLGNYNPQVPLGNGFYGGNFGGYPFWGGKPSTASNPPFPHNMNNQVYYSPAYHGSPMHCGTSRGSPH